MASSGSATAGDSLRSESAVAPTSTSTSSSESECSSLLARLRSPTVSDLCRKRKIDEFLLELCKNNRHFSKE